MPKGKLYKGNETAEALYGRGNINERTVPESLEALLSGSDAHGDDDSREPDESTAEVNPLVQEVRTLVSTLNGLADVLTQHFNKPSSDPSHITAEVANENIQTNENPPLDVVNDGESTNEGDSKPNVPDDIAAIEEKHGRHIPMDGEEESNFIEQELSKTGMTIDEWAKQAPWIIETGQPEVLDRIKDWSIYDQVKDRIQKIAN
jgi:hypothetical protein